MNFDKIFSSFNTAEEISVEKRGKRQPTISLKILDQKIVNGKIVGNHRLQFQIDYDFVRQYMGYEKGHLIQLFSLPKERNVIFLRFVNPKTLLEANLISPGLRYHRRREDGNKIKTNEIESLVFSVSKESLKLPLALKGGIKHLVEEKDFKVKEGLVGLKLPDSFLINEEQMKKSQ